MKNKSTLLLISLILALATAGGSWYWLQNQNGKKAEAIATTRIPVAKETILPGVKLTQEMLSTEDVPVSEIGPGSLTKYDDLIGKVTKDTILQGEAFPKERIYEEGFELISMKIQPGYRAFSITVTQYAAVADLIEPGDSVDIFIYLKEKGATETSEFRPDVARMILQNINVLGIRKETNKTDKAQESSSDVYAVTLSVPVRAIEKLILAEETGMLKLALRPVGDGSEFASYGVVWEELMLDSDMKMRSWDSEYERVTDKNLIIGMPELITPSSGNGPTVENENMEPGKTIESQPIPQKPAAKASDINYTVKVGDTLMSISRKFYNGNVSRYRDIMKANGLSDSVINPGQNLIIPQ